MKGRRVDPLRQDHIQTLSRLERLGRLIPQIVSGLTGWQIGHYIGNLITPYVGAFLHLNETINVTPTVSSIGLSLIALWGVKRVLPKGTTHKTN